MTDATILYEKKGLIATVTLNRPHRGNAYARTTSDELKAAWKQAGEDKDVRVVVFTAAGDRYFCTGNVDFKELSEAGGHTKTTGAYRPFGGGMGPYSNGLWKPVICAVNGLCAGGGYALVAESDFAIASENAAFADTHVSWGQAANYDALGMRNAGVPLGWVFRLALMGIHERIDAKKALELGMVTEVVPHGQLLPRAYELAEKVAQNSPAALRASKQIIWHAVEVSYTEGLRYGWEVLSKNWSHPDTLEGPTAFSQKRKPRWTD